MVVEIQMMILMTVTAVHSMNKNDDYDDKDKEDETILDNFIITPLSVCLSGHWYVCVTGSNILII